MRRILVCIAALTTIHGQAVADDEAIKEQLEQDILLRAMVDELDRSAADLKLEDLARPYFLEYALTDATAGSFSATLGSVTNRSIAPYRRLRTTVRVGSYELDNTNFRGGGFGGFSFSGAGRGGGASIPIENDYHAIRQALWWAADREYKDVVETLAEKMAFMENKIIEDKPDDFSHESPVVYFEPPDDMSIGTAELEKTAITLSRIFREFPDIKNSSVSVVGATGNRYLVNTEGTRIRNAGSLYSISIQATIQADDGMELSDSISVVVRKKSHLPSIDELAADCRTMARGLLALKAAPTLEDYTGPVLFDAQAAAGIVARVLAFQFVGGQRNVGSRTRPDDLAKQLGKRILPRFIDIIDDPTLETFGDTPLLGYYLYDGQGVAAQAISLVEDGRLKRLLMSRNPSKEFSQSTGHGRGTWNPSATIGSFLLTADPAEDDDALVEALLEACEDEDLEFGIRIASLGRVGGGGSGRSGSGTAPLAVYKVFPDGREELVRGAELARIDMKAFKRILAAGGTPHVLNLGRSVGQTVAAPALLFEELDLAAVDRDFDKPPILSAPVSRSATQTD